MTLPQGFIGGALLFWGWEAQLLWVAVPMACGIEGAVFFSAKWDFRAKDFNRFVDMSTILLAAAFIVALVTLPERALILVMTWLPVIFFPIIGAQAFSTGGMIPVRSFFLAARRKKRRSMNRQFYGAGSVDVAPVYAVVCLCAAGTGNPGDPLFYPACFLFSVWALWTVRPRRCPVAVWVLVAMAVGVAGYAGHNGYRSVRLQVYRFMVDFYGELMNPDPFKTSTAIGDIGELKLSGNILFRVSFEPELRQKTVYLHGATYDRFGFNTWFSSYPFEAVSGDGDKGVWQVLPGTRPSHTMTFYVRPGEKELLYLPAGTFQLRNMKAGAVEKNSVSSIRVSDSPSLLRGTAVFGAVQGGGAAPGPRDLFIPKNEEAVIREVSRVLGLSSLEKKAAIRVLKDYFLNEFTYSLALAGRGRAKTAMGNFLTRTQKGHCELFATATVLLLRSAGIPARYATGFLAHEYSNVSRMTLVRQMDAHAWVKAWINGNWIRVDTTPPGFIEADRKDAGHTLLRDIFSFVGFGLSWLRHEAGPRLLDQYGLWLILPLVIILVYRLRFKKKIRQTRVKKRSRETRRPDKETHGLETVARQLGNMGFERFDHDTLNVWFHRIQKGIQPLDIELLLQELIRLENRRRYSHSGLSGDEKQAYDVHVEKILEKLSRE